MGHPVGLQNVLGTGDGRCAERGFVGITERATDGVRGCPHLEPLQQGFGLGVEGEDRNSFRQGYCDRGSGQYVNWISGLHAANAT